MRAARGRAPQTLHGLGLQPESAPLLGSWAAHGEDVRHSTEGRNAGKPRHRHVQVRLSFLKREHTSVVLNRTGFFSH